MSAGWLMKVCARDRPATGLAQACRPRRTCHRAGCRVCPPVAGDARPRADHPCGDGTVPSRHAARAPVRTTAPACPVHRAPSAPAALLAWPGPRAAGAGGRARIARGAVLHEGGVAARTASAMACQCGPRHAQRAARLAVQHHDLRAGVGLRHWCQCRRCPQWRKPHRSPRATAAGRRSRGRRPGHQRRQHRRSGRHFHHPRTRHADGRSLPARAAGRGRCRGSDACAGACPPGSPADRRRCCRCAESTGAPAR